MADTFITVAAYADTDAADTDWEVLMDAHAQGEVGVKDAALVGRDSEGKVDVFAREKRHGVGKGAVAGAVIGVIFPPSLIGSTIVGAAGGSLVGHISRGLARGDIDDLAAAMDKGDVAIIVVTGEDSWWALKAILSGAAQVETRQGEVDARDLEAAMRP